MQVSFPDVIPASEPLPELPFPEAVRQFLKSRREDSFRVEAFCSLTGNLVSGVKGHPFFAALELAWCEHRPLRITPDILWLLIAQGAARHIELNAEELRSQFVKHEGQKDLLVRIRGDELLPGSPENAWGNFSELFAQKLQQTLGSAAELFVPRFTTTGPWEKAAFEIVLMKAMQPWFRYKLGRVICGIPWLTIAGTSEDWKEIQIRVQRLRSLLGIDWWLNSLEVIVNQFVECSHGRIDEPFWRSIFQLKSAGVCTPQSAFGWFAFLLPYLRSGTSFYRNPWLTGERCSLEMWNAALDAGTPANELSNDANQYGIFINSMPLGVTQVPFDLIDYDLLGNAHLTRPMEFLAGFIGISQDHSNLELTPKIGWAVGHQQDPSVNK